MAVQTELSDDEVVLKCTSVKVDDHGDDHDGDGHDGDDRCKISRMSWIHPCKNYIIMVMTIILGWDWKH